MLLLTDGAPESRLADGDPLGYARFADLVSEAAAGPGLDIDRLVASIRAASDAEPDDGWTLVAVTRSEPTAPVSVHES